MQIKIRYDDSFQTVEVTEAECESMIRNDYEERLAAAADPSTVQPRTMQEIMDERFNKPEYNCFHRYRRNTCGLDAFDADSTQFVEPERFEGSLEQSELLSLLHEAMTELQPQQAELIRRVFFEGESPASIAAEDGVLRSSVSHRLTKIYAALQKKLKNFD